MEKKNNKFDKRAIVRYFGSFPFFFFDGELFLRVEQPC